jgi:hypothetical protein
MRPPPLPSVAEVIIRYVVAGLDVEAERLAAAAGFPPDFVERIIVIRDREESA